MGTTTILNQPFNGQLGELLKREIDSTSYRSLFFTVAFAKNSGVLRLKKALEAFRAGGSKIEAYVGIDLGGTSYEALTSLFALVDSLYVVHVESEQTFHPKLYNLVCENTSLLIVGSNNMTGGGLWTNIESSAVISLSLDNESDARVQKEFECYLAQLREKDSLCMRIQSHGDIDLLLDSGYIQKEVIERIERSRTEKSAQEKAGKKQKVFPRRISASLPELDHPREQPKPPSNQSESFRYEFVDYGSGETNPEDNGEGNIIWFETRKLTGGSRNQVDLSMKALIASGSAQGTGFASDNPGIMKGGVQYFGINPQDVEARKSVVINYEGVDYSGNEIYFPKGENANGTWRLQIKGISDDNVKITSALGHHYLVGKVIAFSKVTTDYYYMSVFPDDSLEEFVEVSRVVAYNGSNTRSRLFGLL